MQLAITIGSAAEARLVAAFMQDFAELIEVQRDAVPAVIVPPADVVAQPKKTRAKKDTAPAGETQSAGTASTAVESGSSETAAPATEGNEPAPAASEPAASTEAPAGETTASPAASSVPAPVTLDQLRVLFGELSQAGKRAQAIAVVRGLKANGLAEIAEDKRGEAYAQLRAL